MALTTLPPLLVEADRRLHTVLGRYAWSEYLNPLDGGAAARRAFAEQEAEPELLAYRPLPDADEAIAFLDRTEVPADHPLGRVVADAIAETRAGLVALRDRDAASFDAWNERCGWYPTEDDLTASVPSLPGRPASAAVVSPMMLRAALVEALRERGWLDWQVRFDETMASRVLVDARRRLLRVNPQARFRQADAVSLVAHEIDVHVRRAVEGYRQPLLLFGTGLPGSLVAEEGLALVAEERVGTLATSAVLGQRVLAAAVLVARDASFVELYRWLSARLGPSGAWTPTMRLKRGLADPGKPGVYAKDSVYHLGYTRVRRRVDQPGAAWLFAGKVGLDHPVEEWAAAGWVEAPESLPPWISRPG